MITSSVNLRELIAPCYYDLHKDIREGKHQYYNLPGGRGSAKSSFVAIEIVLGIMRDKTQSKNAIVFRLVGATLRESVYSQILWAIEMLNASHLWKCKVSPLSMEYTPTGQVIIFRGLDDSAKLKSIKPRKGYFAFVWFEEFSEITGEMLLRSVQQSVLRGGKDFIVFRSFNPPMSRRNWANSYIAREDKKAITLLTNYTMIPSEWLGEAFLYEAERLKEINPQAYRNEYLGEPVGDGGEVFPNLEIRTIEDAEIEMMQYIYQGLDFGFAVDPLCFLRLGYDAKTETVFFIDEIYKRHMGNREIAEEIKARKYNDYIVTCDCAEPKSIADLRDNGISAKACYKSQGCVEYRVKWMQKKKIVIDPVRTPNAYREFSQYSYPVDKNGNLESRLIDKDNHSIDSCAYGLDRLIFSRLNSA